MIMRADLCRSTQRFQPGPTLLARYYASMFRSSVAKRLVDTDTKAATTKGWSTRQKEDAVSRDAQFKLVSRMETFVRDRLQKEFPREFEASWFGHTLESNSRHSSTPPLLTLSSFRTLLALNGFQRVVTPSGNKSRLYLAEGVVATPPMKLSFDAIAIPFASGYQEFARGMDIDNAGVFGDVHHRFVTVTKRKDRLFSQPLPERSHLHPDDGKRMTALPPSSSFPEFVQEDVTLYRLAENSAARFIDTTYSSWTGWTQRRFVRPLRDAKYRTRVAIKSANALRAKMQTILEKSIVERVWEELSTIRNRHSTNNNSIGIGNGNGVVTNGLSSDSTKPNTTSSNEINDRGSIKQEKSNEHDEPSQNKIAESAPSSSSPSVNDIDNDNDNGSVDEEKDVDPLETLVVISSRPRSKNVAPKSTRRTERGGTLRSTSIGKTRTDDEGDEIVESVALYRRMTPLTRILALPDYYVLRHSSASTLVSVSLVVFGALPLAYRSYLFSIDYDWLAGSGTIAASVIATVTYGIVSWRWRARTSQSKNLHEALGVRVGARDEAALLLLKEGAVRSVVGAVLEARDRDGAGQDSTNRIARSSNRNSNYLGYALIDPSEWAIDFELLLEEEPTKGRPEQQQQLDPSVLMKQRNCR